MRRARRPGWTSLQAHWLLGLLIFLLAVVMTPFHPGGRLSGEERAGGPTPEGSLATGGSLATARSPAPAGSALLIIKEAVAAPNPTADPPAPPPLAWPSVNPVVPGGRDELVAPVWNDDGDGVPDAVRVCRTPPGDAPLSLCVTDAGAKGAWKPGDIDGDGRAEILSMDGASIRAMKWDGAHFVPTGHVLPMAVGADPGTPTEGIELVDVDGDARLDAVVSLPRDNDSSSMPSDGMWAIRRNTGAAFGPAETLCAVPVLCPFHDMYKGRAAGMDLNGDGRAELLASFSPSDEPDADEVVNTRFYSVGTTDSGAATSRAGWFLTGLGKWLFLDLNGDGLPDAFHAESGGLVKVRYNTGIGFRPSEQISTGISPYLERRRFQAIDTDGDGRQDLLSLSETGPGGALP